MVRSPCSFVRRLLLGSMIIAWLSLRGVVTAQDPPLKTPPSVDDLLLFFPTKHPAGDWNPAGLQFEDVWFQAEDGTQIHGWYCPCASPRATLLFSHGNAGNIATRSQWLMFLQKELRVSKLIYDYRGYGRSQGVASTEGILQDARAARTKLCELASVGEGEIFLMGESVGGAVAVNLAAETAPRALILQSAFTSLRDMASLHYPKLAWLVPKNKLDSHSLITKVHAPVLLSHGTADRIVPFSMAEKLFHAANEPKRLAAIPGADHNDWIGEAYVRELSAFIDRVSLQPKQ